MNNYPWLIKREFWENRAIWAVPSIVGVLLVLAALFGRIELVNLNTPEQSHAAGQMILSAFGVTFFVVMSIYSTWYLLDCLYADRRDRSVLFWKSLPITDTATVLSKLFVGLIVIPLVYFVAADVTTLLVAFIISVRASAIGGAMWHADVWLQLQVLWLYVIITSALWYLPVAAWLMVISAWAKRAVMLWAILPPLALLMGEHWFIGTHVVPAQLYARFMGYLPRAFHAGFEPGYWTTTAFDNHRVTTPTSVWAMLDPATFFSSAAMWIGVAVGAALIVGAIQLRLRRTEI
jgi:ABC-2 type transport system permease protein